MFIRKNIGKIKTGKILVLFARKTTKLMMKFHRKKVRNELAGASKYCSKGYIEKYPSAFQKRNTPI